MLEVTIGVFKTVGAFLFCVVVVAFALLGAGIGHLFDIGSQSVAGGFIGFIVGGATGFIFASCIFGVVHLLISINDNTASLVSLQGKTVRLLEQGSPETGAPDLGPIAAAPEMSPPQEPVMPSEVYDPFRRRLLFLPVGKAANIYGHTVWKRDGSAGSYFETDGFRGSLDELLERLKST